MGYYVSMTNVKFFMAEVNKYHAYRAFKASPLAADVREPIRQGRCGDHRG